jgi:Kef-type K+ transport system membrane component KefB
VLGIALAITCGFGVALLVMGPSLESFFIGVVIASTSTSITVEALHEMDKLKTKSGTAIMGVSIIDDIIGIVILAIVLGMSGSGFSIGTIGITLVKIVAFFIFAVICGFGVNKLFILMYDRLGVKRRLSIFALAFCFLMAYLAEQFGLASITGAYIAGVAFCNTQCAEYLETKVTVLSYMIFTPVFLANIGIHASFEGLSGSVILFTALLVVVSMLSKVIGCGLGARISKFSNSESLQIGIAMMTRGEITLIVASKGISHNLMDSQLFSSIIVVVLITVLITPIFLKAVYKTK